MNAYSLHVCNLTHISHTHIFVVYSETSQFILLVEGFVEQNLLQVIFPISTQALNGRQFSKVGIEV